MKAPPRVRVARLLVSADAFVAVVAGGGIADSDDVFRTTVHVASTVVMVITGALDSDLLAAAFSRTDDHIGGAVEKGGVVAVGVNSLTHSFPSLF